MRIVKSNLRLVKADLAAYWYPRDWGPYWYPQDNLHWVLKLLEDKIFKLKQNLNRLTMNLNRLAMGIVKDNDSKDIKKLKSEFDYRFKRLKKVSNLYYRKLESKAYLLHYYGPGIRKKKRLELILLESKDKLLWLINQIWIKQTQLFPESKNFSVKSPIHSLRIIFKKFLKLLSKSINWLKKLINFKCFLKSNFKKKFRWCKLFKISLFDSKLVINEKKVNKGSKLWPFIQIFNLFFFLKINFYNFYLCIISLLFSKSFWLISFFYKKTNETYKLFEIFIENKKFLTNKSIFYKILLVLKMYGTVLALNSAYNWLKFDTYGKGQQLSKIAFYYNDLIKNSYPLNFWLKKNNILYSKKLKIILYKILYYINNGKFHLKRKDFTCFYSRFFDIGKFLFFKCKILISTSLGKQFFRFFSKLLLYLKSHILNKKILWKTNSDPWVVRYGKSLMR